MKVKYKKVPTSGDTIDGEVDVDKTGTTVGAVAKAAGVDADKMNLSVDDKPATVDTYVSEGATVNFTEKAKGS